ncbi:glycosyltransferase, partial [Methanoregula sp.]|uniref:glycosyltransferase n=1 Tax=Methanoregula sp. TaxID=2052170 RepID=UPI000CA98C8D
LRETIHSVTGQRDPRFEIIAVNDGSPDNSRQILEDLKEEIGDRLIVLTVENGGVSRARNTGVRSSRGKYLAFIDQDDLWAPEKIEEQVALLESDPSMSLSFTNESIIDDQGNLIRENVLTLGARNRGAILEALLFDNFIPISSVMMPREVFDRTGGFRPEYALAEDYDLLLRAAELGTADFIDKPLLKYRTHKESGTFRKIDRIMAESFEILDAWKSRRPDLFRNNLFRYGMFKIKFYFLKLKIRISAGFTP